MLFLNEWIKRSNKTVNIVTNKFKYLTGITSRCFLLTQRSQDCIQFTQSNYKGNMRADVNEEYIWNYS